jgi:nucleoid DNA-binding protein
MSKLILQDLADVLIEKHGAGKKEALQFVSAMFDVIQEGLQTDKTVKIKGLGTFKVIEVDARESVSVNTGGRVVIDSHSKISFTPDAAMKELVNKPFSGFETVMLNDGVTFDDIDSADTNESQAPLVEPIDEKVEEQAETLVPTIEEKVEEPVEEPVEEIVTTEKNIEESMKETIPEGEKKTESSVITEVPEEEQNKEERNQAVFAPVVGLSYDDSDEANAHRNDDHHIRISRAKLRRYALCFVLSCIFSFACGYIFRDLTTPEEYKIEVDTVALVDAAEPDDRSTRMNRPALAMNTNVQSRLMADAEAEEDVLENDVVGDEKAQIAPKPKAPVVQEKPKQEKQKQEKPKQEKPKQAKAEPAPAPQQRTERVDTTIYRRYERMDNRVKTGAYIITGTEKVIKAHEGETLTKIAAKTIGADMTCYLEVYNGIKTPNAPLKEGKQIKIPKLFLKKKLKAMRSQKQRK